MRRVAFAALIATFCVPAYAQVTDQLLRECDKLAGFVWESSRGGGGPIFAAIDGQAAVSACLSAAKAAPEDARTLYQFARALRANWDFDSAVKAYELAAQAGSTRAIFELGVLREQGFGGRSDLSEASRLYEQAVVAGVNEARLALGSLYERGAGVAKDAARANRLYDEAIAGWRTYTRPVAQFTVGWLYQWGELPRNFLEAQRWLEQAANAGHSLAMRNLGMIHEQGGFGLTPNLETAEFWYDRGAQAGEKASIEALQRLRSAVTKR